MRKFHIVFRWASYILISFLYLNTAFAQRDTSFAAPESVGIDSVKKNRILIYPGFGISLIRNEFTPDFFINLGLNHMDRYEVNVNTASFFFFERGTDKNYKVYRNTFLNAEFLLNFSILNKKDKNFNGLGVGYLIETKGQYFRNTTMMFYYKRRHGLFSVMPGIICTDDFKEVFPAITLRL